MYAQYAKLMHFANGPTYNLMSEAALTKLIYNWVGEAQDVYTKDFYFTITYQFNDAGLAVDASILVQLFKDNKWEFLGVFSPFDVNPLAEIVNGINCECVPSDTPSVDQLYYVWSDCPILWNEILFLYNNPWPKPI